MDTQNGLISQYDLFTVISAIVAGTASRAATLRTDTRQVPSVPNGYFIHLINGFIAACLGAVAIPALLTRDYTAVTFLALAVQHFREIRRQEKESLECLDHTEFTRRGDTYIDGISKTFEARNYISLLTALGTVMLIKLLEPRSVLQMAALAAVTGAALTGLMIALTKGKRIGDICSVREADIELRDAALYVDGIYVTNLLGTEQGRALFLEEGVAFVAEPKSPNHRLTLENEGQRQAMLFEAVRSFGVKRYQFTRRSFPDGRLVIAFVPINPDRAGIAAAIRRTPVLESIRKRSHGQGGG